MTLISILLGVIAFFLVLRWDVYDDYKKWLKGILVKHGKEAFLRALLLIPSIALLSLFPFSILKLLNVIALEGFTYLLLFDGWYNHKRGFNFWFLGSVDSGDAWWDKFQRKIPLKWLKVLKIGIPVALIISYLLIK